MQGDENLKSFYYFNPTKLIFGKDAITKLKDALPSGTRKILLHYGRNSIKRSGLYDEVVGILKENKIAFIELGGVTPNPKLEMVEKGIEVCKEEKIDFILAIGGGSVIDSAKAIAAGVNSSKKIWDIFLEGKGMENPLPIGVILTIPATGSESSNATVITDEKSKLKLPFEEDGLRPLFALMNPSLTLTLPKKQTFAGIVDILSHTMERYFPNEENVDLTDDLCEGTMRTVIKNAYKLLEDPNNYDARAEIMVSGTISHSGILGLGRSEDWGSHRIGHEITALYGTTHGETLSIILPAWMKYVYKENIEKFAQFAEKVFGVNLDNKSKEEVAREGIECFESFLKDIDMPISFQDGDIPSHDFELMAKKCTHSGTIGKVKSLGKEDVVKIFELAKA